MQLPDLRPVLHVIADLGVGGAQAALYHLWPSLRCSKKYAFELCVLNSLGQFGEQLVSEGATVHCLESKRKYDPRAVLALRRLIKRGSYKIVHAHLFPELHIASLAAAGLRHVRLVYTEHSSNNRRRSMGAVAKMFDKLGYHPYARVIAVNASARCNLTAWLPELFDRTILIPNAVRDGVNVPRGGAERLRLLAELGIQPNHQASLILFAGRLSHVKGTDVLLTALSQVRLSDYLCLIAGSGPEKGQVEAMTAVLGLGERVRFLGARSDVRNLLAQVDFLVLPSRYEGLPLIVLEAMAAGCPIIATAVDGTADVLSDEVSALLVPPNDPIALAAAIERFIERPSLRNRLAAQAALDAKVYSAERVVEQLLVLYDGLLEDSSPSSNRSRILAGNSLTAADD